MEYVTKDLQGTLDGMVRAIFGDVEVRWINEYFPFTDPSFEMEIFFQDEWLEVLGCGMVHRDVMVNGGVGGKHGYAFGLGLERLAMVLFGIPDIRLFWTEDPRFLEQFADGQIRKFEPYSKFPPCYKVRAGAGDAAGGWLVGRERGVTGAPGGATLMCRAAFVPRRAHALPHVCPGRTSRSGSPSPSTSTTSSSSSALSLAIWSSVWT